MLKIFLNEIKSKKMQYLFTLLYYLSIVGVVFCFKSFIMEYFQNIYNLMIILVFSGGIGTIPMFIKEKTMSIYSKLPLTLMELYLIRLATITIYAISYIIILCFVAIFDIEAINILNIIGIILFSCMIFMFIIHTDLKIYIEKYKWRKRILIYVLPYIYLLAIHACCIFIMKNNKQIFDLIYVKSALILFFISMDFTVSYQIFKLRKSYKA